MRRRRSRVRAAAIPPALFAVASFCAEGDAPPPATFDAAFREERSVLLEEPAGAPLGDLHALAVGGGTWAIIDPQASELRLHDAPDGRLVARLGRPGEGPGELRRPVDVAIHRGIAWVADAAADELTGFAIDGRTVERRPLGGTSPLHVRSLPEGLLVYTSDRMRPRFSVIDPGDGTVLRSFLTEDSAQVAVPYWGGLVDHPATPFGDGVAAAFNLRYPVRLFARDGSERTLGTPPADWREAHVPVVGEFAGRGQSGLAEYLTGISTIERLDALGSSRLLVTHGGYEMREEPGVPFRRVQTTLDAWDESGRRVFEGVRPPGRVLGAVGDTLYVLTGEPPAGWTLTLFTLRD